MAGRRYRPRGAKDARLAAALEKELNGSSLSKPPPPPPPPPPPASTKAPSSSASKRPLAQLQENGGVNADGMGGASATTKPSKKRRERVFSRDGGSATSGTRRSASSATSGASLSTASTDGSVTAPATALGSCSSSFEAVGDGSDDSGNGNRHSSGSSGSLMRCGRRGSTVSNNDDDALLRRTGSKVGGSLSTLPNLVAQPSTSD